MPHKNDVCSCAVAICQQQNIWPSFAPQQVSSLTMPAVHSVPSSSSSKRQRVQQPMWGMMPPQVMPQQMWGMMPPSQMAPLPDSQLPDDQEEPAEFPAPASVERHARPEPGMDNVPGADHISRSVTFLKTVPRQRLSEGLEWIRNCHTWSVIRRPSSGGLHAHTAEAILLRF